jgi:predicted RNA-binding protein
MCLAVVYVNGGDGKKEVMQDVVRIESENRGYRLVGIMGEEKFVEGQLKSVDFFEDHSVLIEAK